MKRIFALLCLVAVGTSIGCDDESSSADKDAQFKEDVHPIAEAPRANEDRGDESGLQALRAATRKSIEAIDMAVTLYNIKVAKMPKRLDDLTVSINGKPPLVTGSLKDAWGNPFEYKVNGRNFTIRSAGPDGKMNTEDDITN